MSRAAWTCIGVLGSSGAIFACSGSSSSGPSDGGAKGDAAVASDAPASGDAGPGPAGDGAGDEGPSSDDAGPGGGPADGAGGSDGGTAGEGGAVSCTGPDAAGLPYTGIVELSRVMMPPAAPRFGGIAQFDTTATAPPSSGCSGTLMGPCCYEMTATTTPTAATAGTVTVTDATNTLGTLTGPGYAVSSATVSTFTWTPGTVLKVSSSGGMVDAFMGMVAAPALLAGVTPALTATVNVPLKSDLVVSWTPAKEACSQISFGLSQGALMPHIGCVMDDAAGTLTVPAALLGMLTASTGTVVMERIEPRRVLTTNAGIGIIAVNVQQANATFTP
ncbi:MAG TPA: hypothetical protein VKU41_22940 [Polyangiaceae bacterium]|nr:hypothetical protein [Polyangiaceae bacterium]